MLLVNVVLVISFLFLAFRYLESSWSYRISKPFAWEAALKNGRIPRALKKTERFYRDKVRFYTFWLQIERLKEERISGAFAEVGVYKGETARIIHAMDPSRRFHLFDTFEGFAKQDLDREAAGDEEYNNVDFSDTSVEYAFKFIRGNEQVIFHKGHFPESAEGIAEESYALVHVDVDLYQPTLAALKYYYPKLAAGGVVIVHDYNHTWGGVKKAVDEFAATIPESMIPVADWQGSVMLVKSGM